MKSREILDTALSIVHDAIIDAEEADCLPELDVYVAIEKEDTLEMPQEASSGTVSLIDRTADEKNEPGLHSSIQHGEQSVSTASSERVKANGSDQNAEDFFSGAAWDDQSETQSPVTHENANSPAAEKVAEDANSFFGSANWEGESAAAEQTKDQTPESQASPESDSAEEFFEQSNWESAERRVSIDPNQSPPEHVRDFVEPSKTEDFNPTEDAVKRSNSKKDQT